ncbi:hypothetical protein ASG52_21615 [Methylobacterium sp. Leaf456]|uniref:nucleotidyltransferase family protein n=1 Tax=Methylobacterium sp. Leaf456 TaxID=1736382 RepID=UPI0006FF7D54|nr:nucleotidyltransferase family protein [Methylobacterium sp. Leaf456]KQT58460.1 hypothetical protein ASG52_21615 [Methylobacterium sp. Leaf456]
MLPAPSDRLLLRAALEPPWEALACFARWREQNDLNDVVGTAFRLLPLVYDNIGQALPDDAIKARLRGIARHVWLRSRSRWHLCAAAIDRLTEREIPLLLTKGTALVVILGGATELRFLSDCDILVPPERAAEAVAILFDLGFVTPRLAPGTFHVEDHRSMHGLDFAHPEDAFGLLDLHWRPLLDVESEALAEEFFAQAQSGMLNGRAVRVPSLEHVFLQAAIHGSKFEEPLRHDWMADCHLMMRLVGERIDWRRLWASAERHGLAGLLEVTLDLLADTIVPPLPSSVWRRRNGRATALERREALGRLKHPADRSKTDWFALDLKRLHRSAPALSRQPLDACLPTLRERMRAPALPTRPAEDHSPLWFVSGWSHIEPHGRWSDGSVAVLALRPPAGPGRTLVLRTVSVAPADQAAPSAGVIVDGRPLARLQGRAGVEPSVTETVLDLSDASLQDGWVVVQFRIADPFIPARLDRRGDPRQLGVLLVSAVWAEAEF